MTEWKIPAHMTRQDERIEQLEARIAELEAPIRKLRELLSKDGDYSICRTEGRMTIADAVMVGDVLEAIDAALGEGDDG